MYPNDSGIYDVTVDGLIPGRQYKYRFIVTNSEDQILVETSFDNRITTKGEVSVFDGTVGQITTSSARCYFVLGSID